MAVSGEDKGKVEESSPSTGISPPTSGFQHTFHSSTFPQGTGSFVPNDITVPPPYSPGQRPPRQPRVPRAPRKPRQPRRSRHLRASLRPFNVATYDLPRDNPRSRLASLLSLAPPNPPPAMSEDQGQIGLSPEAELALTLAQFSPAQIADLIQQMSERVEKLHGEVTAREGKIQHMDGQIINLVKEVQQRDGMLGQAAEKAHELRARIQQLEEANQALNALNAKLMQQAKASTQTSLTEVDAEVMVRPKNAREALANLSNILQPSRTF